MSDLLDARDLLVQYHVDSPSEEQLMQAAFEGALKATQKHGLDINLVARNLVARHLVARTGEGSCGSSVFSLPCLIDETRGKVPRGELIEAAISAMTVSLNDLHTTYIPESYWKALGGENERMYYTPLFMYQVVYTSQGFLVWDVAPGSRAERGGLRVGDTIIAINGSSVLYGSKKGSEVKKSNVFTVISHGGERAELAIEPEPLSMRPFEARMIGDVAYFQLYGLPPLDWHIGEDALSSNLRSALTSLAANKPEGWILDLRGNLGGATDTMAVVGAAFGAVGRMSDQTTRAGEHYTDYATGPLIVGNTPVAVLINGGTVSAGEILAFNLQESAGAYLIGAKSRGSVRGAWRVPLRRGGGLSISVTSIEVGRTGQNLEGVGVSPDEIVKLDAALVLQGRDNQLERALAWVQEEVGNRESMSTR